MKFYKVYLKSKERKFIFHSPLGRSIQFVKISEGLLYHDTTTKCNKKSVVVVDVVKELMECYTRRNCWMPKKQCVQW